jgi:hypothetical protein
MLTECLTILTIPAEFDEGNDFIPKIHSPDVYNLPSLIIKTKHRLRMEILQNSQPHLQETVRVRHRPSRTRGCSTALDAQVN